MFVENVMKLGKKILVVLRAADKIHDIWMYAEIKQRFSLQRNTSNDRTSFCYDQMLVGLRES